MLEGLYYSEDFVSPDQEHDLLARIDSQSWNTELKRRVQHFGYRYSYSRGAVDPKDYLGPLPEWLAALSERLPFEPDQVIVNEYTPGQGISAHIDAMGSFGPMIATVSLGSQCVMQFKRAGHTHERPLRRRSLLVLSGAAREQWSHAIPGRKTDSIDGVPSARTRRVSVTFRTVIIRGGA